MKTIVLSALVIALLVVAIVVVDTPMYDLNSRTWVVVGAGQAVRVHRYLTIEGTRYAEISYCIKFDACYWGVVPVNVLELQ